MRTARVSIPNGMEFYCSVRILRLEILMVSIPNGMEFYHIRHGGAHLCVVSIPNGMEFYLAAISTRLRKRMFQFPTGWNST